MKRLLAALLTLFVVFGFGMAAQADTCQSYSNHNGFVPGSYDYAVFIESGYQTLTVETNGQNINIPPPQGRNSWDTVRKCNYTTTTTSSTTTTTQPTTTTTAPTTTTTSSPTSTTSTTTTLPTSTTTMGSTTSTTPAWSTTSTAPPASSTTAPTVSTTTPDPTTQPEVTTTADFCAHDEVDGELTCLPFTGIDTGMAALAGAALVALGALLVRSRYAR